MVKIKYILGNKFWKFLFQVSSEEIKNKFIIIGGQNKQLKILI